MGSLIELSDFLLSFVIRTRNPWALRGAGRGPGGPRSFLVRNPPALAVLAATIFTIFTGPGILPWVHPNVWIVRVCSLSMLGIVFLGLVVASSGFGRRLWCVYLCPLGALYGLCARVPLPRLSIARCTRCGACDRCPMQAADGERHSVLAHQCILCFDFEHDCAAEGFRFIRAVRRSEFDPGRRQFLITGASLAAGMASFLTPKLRVDRNGCDFRCQVCQLVCPNQAIPLQTLEEKQRTPIGLAAIDEKKCVVFKDKRPCLVCEEVCPTPEKAIVFEREERILRSSGPTTLTYPAVVASLCIGCGICQANCPADQVAIVVSRRASIRRATSTLSS